MVRSWRLAFVATIAGVIGLLAPAAGADPPQDLCISRNGVVVVQTGTAQCFAVAGAGNVAIARGANSVAYVQGGIGNKAYANVESSCALVLTNTLTAPTPKDGVVCTLVIGPGDSGAPAADGAAGYNRNTATASGIGSAAVASMASSSKAVAKGAASLAVVGGGDDNEATAEGDNSCAAAGNPTDIGALLSVCTAAFDRPMEPTALGPLPLLSDHNEATAGGDGSVALAILGSHNEADAIGTPSAAVAGFGNHNDATASGDCSGASAGAPVFVGTGMCAPPAPTPKGSETPMSGSGPACAIGAPVYGNGNSATASGYSSFAAAALGCDNSATASGDHSLAVAAGGNDNKARATNDGSCASAGYMDAVDGPCNPCPVAPATTASCDAVAPRVPSPLDSDGNIATASGIDSIAVAGPGDRNRATATATSSIAIAGPGDRNRVTAATDS